MRRTLLAVLVIGLLSAANPGQEKPAQKPEAQREVTSEQETNKQRPSLDEAAKKEATQKKQKAAVDEAARKELARLQGQWALESLEQDGKQVSAREFKERTLFFGDDKFLMRQGSDLLSAGVVKLYPAKAPKAINATVLQGTNKGTTMMGIYELNGDTLKLCFDTLGEERVTQFKTKPDSGQFLGVYKRQKPTAAGAIEITGKYRVEEPAQPPVEVEIEKHGDAYMIKWSSGGQNAYLGVGIRNKDLLSVAWVSRGQAGVSVYHIEKGPRLVGEWADLGGIGTLQKEILVPKHGDDDGPLRGTRRSASRP